MSSALPRYTPEQLRAHAQRIAARKHWAMQAVPDEGINLKSPGGHRGETRTIVVMRSMRPAGGVAKISVASLADSYRKGFAEGFAAALAQFERSGGHPSCRTIIKAVGSRYGMAAGEILGQRRHARLSLARHVAMYLARMLTHLSFPEIGRRFGGKDHSSVVHACGRIEARIASDPDTAALVASLKAELSAAVLAGRAA